VLCVEDLHARYGLSHVLQGVSLQGEAGEVVGLFGRNGVGKTTILKSVVGWVRPTAGSVQLDGIQLSGLRPDEICRRGIGFVPEDRRIFPGLSVEENLLLGRLQSPGRSREFLRQSLERVYARFPRLRERRRQMGTTLSGGEQQMLAIARVLMGAPRVMLIDEPTEGLAPMIVSEIFELISELAADGLLVLLVEQNVHRALEVATRFYAIERGQVIFEGSGRDASARDQLLAAIAL
jgi:branched-chain amino acid transport system ATP-binding protein